MTLPPLSLVQESLLSTVLPPAAAGALVFAAVLGIVGRQAALLGAVLALVAGLAAGNYFRAVIPWVPGTRTAEWIPYLALAAAIAASLMRVPKRPLIGAALWALVMAIVVVRLLPRQYHLEPLWMLPAFVLTITAVGFGLGYASLKDPGAIMPAVAALALYALSAVCIHASSARLMDMAVIAGSTLAGMALVAGLAKADTAAAMPAVAVLLVGIAFTAQYESYSNVRWGSFALAAVAPLLVLVSLVPPVAHLTGWKLRAVQVVLVLIPASVAVAFAVLDDPIDFSNL